jgi:hypothetical protein
MHTHTRAHTTDNAPIAQDISHALARQRRACAYAYARRKALLCFLAVWHTLGSSVMLMMERPAEAYHATQDEENGFLVLTFGCLAFRLPCLDRTTVDDWVVLFCCPELLSWYCFPV